MTTQYNAREAKRTQVAEFLAKHEGRAVEPIVKEAFVAWRSAANPDDRNTASHFLGDLIGLCFSYADKDAHAIAWEFAREALQHPDDMPAEVEFGLVIDISSELALRHMRKDFSQDADARAEVTRSCAHALGRFSAIFDPAWIATPPNLERNKMFSGPDAERRSAAYHEESALLNRRYIEQQYLHRFERLYLPILERKLANIYSQPPAASKELEKCLLDHGVDEEITARILSAVRPIEK